jgi:hypothetical protein
MRLSVGTIPVLPGICNSKLPDHFAVSHEPVTLVSPDDFIAGKTAAPDNETHKITNRV